ncbi:MAG: twin-arginine translocase subunit TatB [Sphingomonas sp.]|nr:twin-arginine translocase subunit TatB [Sphingomonas sp.]
MFGVDSIELVIIAVAALLFIGPKDLPKVMMAIGKWVGKMRGMARHFTAGVDNIMREAELEEMERKWSAENQRILSEFPAGAVYPDPAPRGPDDAIMTALPEAEPLLPLEAGAAPDSDPIPTTDRPLP